MPCNDEKVPDEYIKLLLGQKEDVQKFLNEIKKINTEQVKMDSKENSVAKDIIENVPKEKDVVKKEDAHQNFFHDFNDESNKTNTESVKMDSEENSIAKDIIENIPKEKDFLQEEDDNQKFLDDINYETNAQDWHSIFIF